jgi:hypothetical protein
MCMATTQHTAQVDESLKLWLCCCVHVQDDEDGLVTRAQDMQATVDDKYSSLHKALQAAGGSTKQLMQDVSKHTQQQQDQLAAHVQVRRMLALDTLHVLAAYLRRDTHSLAVIVDGTGTSGSTLTCCGILPLTRSSCLQDVKAVAQKGATTIQAAVLEASEQVSQMATGLTSASGQMQTSLEAMQQADSKAAEDISTFAHSSSAAVEGTLHG